MKAGKIILAGAVIYLLWKWMKPSSLGDESAEAKDILRQNCINGMKDKKIPEEQKQKLIAECIEKSKYSLRTK